MSSGPVTVEQLIERFWIAPEDAVWTPKTDILPLPELQQWMKSADMEVLGFVYALIGDPRFRIVPPISVEEYVAFVKRYFERCFLENPHSEWADSSYSAGWDLVGVFVKLWDDTSVARTVLLDLKNWLADLYKRADERLQTCIVQATLEHIFERKPIRKYFADWKTDSVLGKAYDEACIWDRKTPLSR